MLLGMTMPGKAPSSNGDLRLNSQAAQAIIDGDAPYAPPTYMQLPAIIFAMRAPGCSNRRNAVRGSPYCQSCELAQFGTILII
jgi:hypothetical protein